MQVYLGLGSNLGNREDYLKEALRRLEVLSSGPTLQSPLYESKALVDELDPKYIKTEPYLNQVICIETDISASDLLPIIKGFEKLMGRADRGHWAKREIDIDILLYGDLYISKGRFQVPHIGLSQRQFMLAPLVDIAPKIIHPTEKVAAKAMLDGLRHFEGDDLCQIWKSQD